MTEKSKYLGRESGKSSMKFFGGEGHSRGYGASAGDGKTVDKSIAGRIKPEFKSKK